MRQTDTRLKMLVVDDLPEHLELVCRALSQESVQLFTAPSAESALERFMQVRPRIVLSDLRLPGLNGLELLERILAKDPGVDFIIMTGYHSTESAVDAIRKGARDYLAKPLDLKQLCHCVRTLVEEAERRQRTFRLDQDLVDEFQFEGMIGRSPLMLEVFSRIRRVAPHFPSVLVSGETGTGKELVAKALHKLGPAPEAPFAVCNCSALMESLLESELFGYVRGAFTGATQDKQGVFEFADGGTVFLDEVGELKLPAQAKLLRVLQNHEVQRVGSPVLHQVDVHIVAATHRNLRDMVARGQFREDLFYRLSVIEISVPRLSQRKEDIPLLQRYFLDKYSKLYKKNIVGITRRASARLMAHPWPGNVRELENTISGGCIMCLENLIDLQDLPGIFQFPAQESNFEGEELATLDVVQQRYLRRVLDLVGGNKAKAAEILGVGRNTIYQMLARTEQNNEDSLRSGATESA